MRCLARGNHLAIAGAILLLSPVVGRAQAAPPAPADASPSADSVSLVFEREVFSYPSYERRNPFRPLTGDEGGPRFENLIYVGRLIGDQPGTSIAVIQARPVGQPRGAQSERLPTYRLRVGDVLGNTRVLEIREDQLVAEVEEFGVFDVQILELRRTAASERGTEVRTAPATTATPPGSNVDPAGQPLPNVPAGQAPPSDTIPPPVVGPAVPLVGSAENDGRTVNGGRT